MSMITCTATQFVKKGREYEIEKLMDKLAQKIEANEPGCTLFQYSRSTENTNEYFVIEQYVDQNALDIHHQTEYLKEFIPKMMDCLEKDPIIKQFDNVFPKVPPSSPFFHIGIVVEDLEKAMERYSKILGLTFTEPAKFHVPQYKDPHPHPIDLIAVYSRQGPPYFELIQATGDGLFSAKNANQILYAGVWETNVKDRIQFLKDNKVGIEAILSDSQDNPFVVLSSPEGLGIRVEFVGDGARPLIEEWVETGKFVGAVAE